MKINFIKIYTISYIAIWLVLIALFFIGGDEFHYRDSRENLLCLDGDQASIELAEGNVVEQYFSSNIDCLTSMGVKFGTYYRQNSGVVHIELFDAATNEVLISDDIEASSIIENEIVSISSAERIESYHQRPLGIRLYANSHIGEAVTPIMKYSSGDGSISEAIDSNTNRDLNKSGQLTNNVLYINGVLVDGTLCFSLSGQEYIWTGQHYWVIAVIFGFIILMLFVYECVCYKKSRKTYLNTVIFEIKKYQYLIKQLIIRDFKVRYKRSVLGFFWSVLNPLLAMIVQYFVFSTIFGNNLDHYQVYLLVGIVAFNFFNESVSLTLNSVVGNANLIKKVYMPKYIYPLSRTLSSCVNLVLSLIPLSIVSLYNGVYPNKATIVSLFFLICVVIFSLGVGMLLSTSMVFFRDTQFLWGVVSMMWLYATPIFYPESLLLGKYEFVLSINPMYIFIKNMRICVISGVSPEPRAFMQCAAIALGTLIIGNWVFKKFQNRFVLYL